jgi:hypothetical protein
MKIFKTILPVALLAVILSSCAMTVPYAVTNNAIGSKKGVSSTGMIWSKKGLLMGNLSAGMVFNSKFGVLEAVKKGGLTTVATVDVKTTNYIFFVKREIIVTGE